MLKHKNNTVTNHKLLLISPDPLIGWRDPKMKDETISTKLNETIGSPPRVKKTMTPSINKYKLLKIIKG